MQGIIEDATGMKSAHILKIFKLTWVAINPRQGRSKDPPSVDIYMYNTTTPKPHT